MKKQTRKFEVKKETVRALTGDSLVTVMGGVPKTSVVVFCAGGDNR